MNADGYYFMCLQAENSQTINAIFIAINFVLLVVVS